MAAPSATPIDRLRRQYYNAGVESLRRVSESVLVLRVSPDAPFPPFEAGQYGTLGLGYWEPQVARFPVETASDADARLAKRPYSITCSLLDENNQLVRAGDQPYLEFLVSLVRRGDHTPALTPRLFALEPGSRLYLAPAPHGRYTLQGVRDDDAVIFAATGAGEAPHNAMLAELLHRGHRGRLVSLVCVRYYRDLAYADAHRRLERLIPNYRFVATTTREPENLDPSLPDFVGKRYLQEYVASDDFERELHLPLSPESTHIFLCGSPAMIGLARSDHLPAPGGSPPAGMVPLLQQRGFRVDSPHEPGNIHCEKYW